MQEIIEFFDHINNVCAQQRTWGSWELTKQPEHYLFKEESHQSMITIRLRDDLGPNWAGATHFMWHEHLVQFNYCPPWKRRK